VLPPFSGDVVMTNQPFSVFVIEMDIARYQAMLKLDMDNRKRAIIERLLSQAKHDLVLAKNCKDEHGPATDLHRSA
jgi:hypothetical protein